MRVKEIRKIVLFIGIGIIKKGRGISQGEQIHPRPSQMSGIQITQIQNKLNLSTKASRFDCQDETVLWLVVLNI